MSEPRSRNQLRRKREPSIEPALFKDQPGEPEADSIGDAVLKAAGPRFDQRADALSHSDATTRVEVINRLQQQHGNAYVQRLVKKRAADQAATSPAQIEGEFAADAPSDGSGLVVQRDKHSARTSTLREYVPEMSVKPDSAEINMGDVHTERLDIRNTNEAPMGRTLFGVEGTTGQITMCLSSSLWVQTNRLTPS